MTALIVTALNAWGFYVTRIIEGNGFDSRSVQERFIKENDSISVSIACLRGCDKHMHIGR